MKNSPVSSTDISNSTAFAPPKTALPRGVIITLCAIGAVYIAFLFVDVFSPQHSLLSGIIKYSGMLLCLLLAIFSFRRGGGSRDARLVLAALSFTLAADILLLFTPYFTVGITIFCGTHLTYILRFRPDRFRLFVLLAAVGLSAAALSQFFPDLAPASASLVSLLAAAIVYAMLILSATVFTFRAPLPRPNSRLARLGMLLFLLCDVNVALFNLLPYGTHIHNATALLMWFFYLPSQALLALSAYPFGGQAKPREYK